MCRNSNLSVQRKNVEKFTVERTVFRLFWTLTRKTCIFTGIFLAGLSKLLSTCSEDQLQSNISERRSWNLEDFWIVFEIFGTTAENIFQGWQKSNRCPGEQFMENIFFRWEKFAIFSHSERLSYFWRKTLPDLRKSQSTYPWKFLGKNIFWNLYNLPHLFGLWSKKRLVGKVFSRVVTTAIHASRGLFWLKVIFLRKVIFVHLFWSLSKFWLSFDKKVRVSEKQPTNTEKNWRKNL